MFVCMFVQPQSTNLGGGWWGKEGKVGRAGGRRDKVGGPGEGGTRWAGPGEGGTRWAGPKRVFGPFHEKLWDKKYSGPNNKAIWLFLAVS